MTTMRPFLMFGGRAEEAMAFYVSLFEDGGIVEVQRYRGGKAGAEGAMMYGVFRVAGQTLLCSDSVTHGFAFSPAISLSVDCGSDEEIARLSKALGEDGEVLMPSDDYGFSQKFTWITDRFGVTWQLNLPRVEA